MSELVEIPPVECAVHVDKGELPRLGRRDRQRGRWRLLRGSRRPWVDRSARLAGWIPAGSRDDADHRRIEIECLHVSAGEACMS
jgi:hypothetical protein